MKERTGVLNLCPDCQRKKSEEAYGRTGEKTKDDFWKKRRESLARAERCRFLYHHGLYDVMGKEDALFGQRICSFTIKAECGHEVSKYGQCLDWLDGKFCNDWEEKA